MNNKTVLITGASSGFGKLTAKKFHNEGWNVIATLRSPEKENELNQLENVLVTKLDVTDVSSIKTAINEGLKRFGAIDALVNNAGYGGYGLFEQYSDEEIRAKYETNVFGLMNVTREVLPLMRKQKNGAIINIASLVGICSAPTVSVYASTKYAVMGFSEGLALELQPLNIRVKTILPGHFGTNFDTAAANNLEKGDDELKEYASKIANQMAAARNQMRNPDLPEPDSQDVADQIYKCITQETPIHNPVGADTESIIEMRRSMSDQEFLNTMSDMLLPK